MGDTEGSHDCEPKIPLQLAPKAFTTLTACSGASVSPYHSSLSAIAFVSEIASHKACSCEPERKADLIVASPLLKLLLWGCFIHLRSSILGVCDPSNQLQADLSLNLPGELLEMVAYELETNILSFSDFDDAKSPLWASCIPQGLFFQLKWCTRMLLTCILQFVMFCVRNCAQLRR
jgi:hypothetical protein